jgi:hypothetical protein
MKKYPQDTFRVHKLGSSLLCTLLAELFSFCLTVGQFVQPPTAPEQFNIEHPFIPGSKLQFLIDTVIVLFLGVDADEHTARNIRSIMPVNVAIQDPPFRARESIDPLDKAINRSSMPGDNYPKAHPWPEAEKTSEHSATHRYHKLNKCHFQVFFPQIP